MSFHDHMRQHPWKEIAAKVRGRSASDVEAALAGRSVNLEGMLSLLSPAATPYLEEMARRAHRLTLQRFGRTIQMFAPLYLSNECVNACVYCGFNRHNPIERRTLSVDEAEAEGRAIHDLGFRHLLLVSGETPHRVSLDYLRQVLNRLRPRFSSISIELHPMGVDAYEALIDAGVDGLVVFQETYNEERYGDFHPRGKKRDFLWRLETPERGARAGFRRVGLGALLGLCDWRVEGFYLALHAQYLFRNFWRSQVNISFPRLRPAAGRFEPPHPVSDLHFVQLLLALRLFLPDAGLVLSTRESPSFRDHLIPLGVTTMSAGSHTEPGGYSRPTDAEAQFSVCDDRPPGAVAEVIRNCGYEPVWKDWDAAFLQ